MELQRVWDHRAERGHQEEQMVRRKARAETTVAQWRRSRYHKVKVVKCEGTGQSDKVRYKNTRNSCRHIKQESV